MIRSIAFDVFDTLYPMGPVKLFDAFRQTEQRILREEGIEFDEKIYWKAVQITVREIETPEWVNNKLRFPLVLLKNMKIQKDGLAEKIGKEFGIMNKQYKGVQPAIEPAAKEVIPYLHQQNIMLSIISDTDEDWVRHQLKRDKLDNYFSGYYLSCEVGFGKGSGIPFQRFLADMGKNGILPDECAMVGDLFVDMEAKKYGLKTVLYNPRGNPYSHFNYPPDYVIQSHAELKNIVKNS